MEQRTAADAITDYLLTAADGAKRNLDSVRRQRYAAQDADDERGTGQSALASRLLIKEAESYATWTALENAWFEALRIQAQQS